ncbi:MAG: hypothetical protein LBN21_11315 [Treponema sp.]|jgi:hypothetical protein|nr:hypothetical protein [Treponema sp.]
MKKKMVILALVCAVASASLSAEDFRFGIFGGGFFQMDFSTMSPRKGGGAFVNLDFTFVELGIGIVGESAGFNFKPETISDWTNGNTYTNTAVGFVNGLSSTGLNLSLNGKLPITFGNLSLFPLLGLRYDIMLDQKISGGKKIGESVYDEIAGMIKTDGLKAIDFSNFFINLGGGLDFAIYKHFFFREEFIWAFKIPNKFDIAYAKYQGKDAAKEFFSYSEPTIMLSVGFKL